MLQHGVITLPGPFGQSGEGAKAMQDLASASQFAGKFPVAVWGAAELQVHARMVPVQGMWERWESAFQAIHPVLLKPSLDPGLELTLQRLVTMGPEAIAGIRSRVIADIRARWDGMKHSTQSWPHVQRAYTLPDRYIVQLPLFISLLRGCGHPDCDSFEEASTKGFPVTREMGNTPGGDRGCATSTLHPFRATLLLC